MTLVKARRPPRSAIAEFWGGKDAACWKCGVLTSHLERAHLINEAEYGGTVSCDNLVLLCWQCHHEMTKIGFSSRWEALTWVLDTVPPSDGQPSPSTVALKRRMAKGLWVGPGPYGFACQNGKLCIHPEEAQLIRDVVQWGLAGGGLPNIVASLNAASRLRRNGGLWTPPSLLRTLREGRWFGTAVLGGQAVQIPRILQEADWERALVGFTGNVDPRFFRTYLLTPRLLRGACGALMSGVYRSDRGSSWYRCANKRSELRDKCSCRSVNVDWADEIVWGVVVDILNQPVAMCKIADRLGVSVSLEAAARLYERLTKLNVRERRQVLLLLNVSVAVEQWVPCSRCEGKGKVTGGYGGAVCSKCRATRWVPRMRIEGVVPAELVDSASRDVG